MFSARKSHSHDANGSEWPQIVIRIIPVACGPGDVLRPHPGLGEPSQIITMDVIYVGAAAKSANAGIACCRNPVIFFWCQLAGTATTQYSVRHESTP